jgi:hypothetical protein
MTFADFLNQHWSFFENAAEFIGVVVLLWLADRVVSK